MSTILSSKDVRVDAQGRCSLAHKSLRHIPFAIIGGKRASQITELDLSFNYLTDLPNLDWFPNLRSLVVDNNRLQSNSNFNSGKALPNLELLWVNGCHIKHLAVWIDKIAACCPNLKMFSMLKNHACPNFFNGGTVQQYNDYRLFVLSRLRRLTVLDSTPVTEEERREAIEQYGDLKIEPKLVQLRQKQKRQQQQQQQQLASGGNVDNDDNDDGLTLPDVEQMEQERNSALNSVLPDVEALAKQHQPSGDLKLPDPSQL